MNQSRNAHEILHFTVPVMVALLALATAPRWELLVTVPAATTLLPLPVLVVVMATMSLYAPVGRRTLGLGAVGLPVAIWSFGIPWAGWVAGGAFVLGELLRRFLFGVPLRHSGSIHYLPIAADAARVSLAAMMAGSVWVSGLTGGSSGEAGRLFWIRGAMAMGVYLVTLLLLHLPESLWVAPQRRWSPREVVRSCALAAGGWVVGGAIARVVSGTGWSEALLLLAGVAVLAAGSARNVYLRKQAVARVRELWEVTRAGHRIIFRDPDLASMAGHVLEECRNVMSFQWFQFELLQGEGGAQSWFAGPEGHVEEGIPEPADSPPALPGIHRRSSWRILQRQLRGDGEAIAMLRLWCDPRRLETTAVELLDSLLPQIAAAVHRALLDRKAKQDPLTGLADRRVLESRLEQVFAATHGEGGSMAVIMCDLDRFKKINDSYGHDVGDRALLQVVQVMEEHRRDTDLCSRYGGEEFALVLERTDGETALRIAERLRLEVQRCRFVSDGVSIPLRLSAGVAAYPELHVKTGRDLLLIADEALMQAKKRGRNRSLLHQGRGRYRTSDGKMLNTQESPQEPEAPTLFA